MSRRPSRRPDAATTTALATAMSAHGVTQYWIVISPVQAQMLRDGVVSDDVKRQCRDLLGEPDVFDPVWLASGGSRG